MNRFIATGIALFVLGALPATAADLRMPLKAAPLETGFSWTGFYVGGNVGAARSRSDFNVLQNFTAGDPGDNAFQSQVGSQSLSKTGVIGGAQTGYNWQIGNAVLGFEADFDWQGLRQSTNTGAVQFPSTPGAFFSVATSANNDWLFTGRQRIGFAASNWLVYGTGGLAVGQASFTQTYTLIAPSISTVTASSTRVGWTAGAGIEYAVSRNWSVKAEYLYVDLGSVSATGTLIPNNPIAGYSNTTTVRLREDIARVGFNYRFDAGPVVARY